VPAPERAARILGDGGVVDASIVLKLLLPEAQSETVHRLWSRWVERDTEIVAPFLLADEVVSVLRNKGVRGELTPEGGDAAFAAFRSQEVSLLHPDGIEDKAWALAKTWKLQTTYDATYLAVAELLDYEFWTADRRFVAQLGKKAPRLRVIIK
jgi:predicted nucleic acid-binding protein